MQVASLNLCKELYELSGWDGCSCTYEYTKADFEPSHLVRSFPEAHWNKNTICPAYDLGYLLRKLPDYIENYQLILAIGEGIGETGTWQCGYYIPGRKVGRYIQTELTPEDAVCKLAIELWKQGVLHE